MKFYINPECAPFYYKDGVKHTKSPMKKVKGYAYNAEGDLLPCCWCDSAAFKPCFGKLGFLDEHMKLYNNDSVDDIIVSDVWSNWLDIICHRPTEAPKVCIQKCGQHE